MDDINITENGIKKLLNDLNPCQSPGLDNIGPQVLKEHSTYPPIDIA